MHNYDSSMQLHARQLKAPCRAKLHARQSSSTQAKLHAGQSSLQGKAPCRANSSMQGKAPCRSKLRARQSSVQGKAPCSVQGKAPCARQSSVQARAYILLRRRGHATVQPSKFFSVTIFRTRSIGGIGMRAGELGLCCYF